MRPSPPLRALLIEDELDGFGIVQCLGPARMPAFIFVTAFAEYAVRAFEVEAVDYLCKPFDQERLSAAVQRARRHLRAKAEPAPARPRPATPETPAEWRSRITVKEEAGITFVPVEDVLWSWNASSRRSGRTISHPV